MNASNAFERALKSHGIEAGDTLRTLPPSAADIEGCNCCTRKDSTPAKRYLDGFGDALRCWVCWSADALRHPETGALRYIADRVRNNFTSRKFGYPNADSTMHGVAPVCFWHNDPRDVAAGILDNQQAPERAHTLVTGGTYADLLA